MDQANGPRHHLLESRSDVIRQIADVKESLLLLHTEKMSIRHKFNRSLTPSQGPAEMPPGKCVKCMIGISLDPCAAEFAYKDYPAIPEAAPEQGPQQ
jgi:hypothetical protein